MYIYICSLLQAESHHFSTTGHFVDMLMKHKQLEVQRVTSLALPTPSHRLLVQKSHGTKYRVDSKALVILVIP